MQDGRATKIQGILAHPVTRGFLCAEVAKYLDRVYSPDRVLYPMRRIAPKGLVGERQPSLRPDSPFDFVQGKLGGLSPRERRTIQFGGGLAGMKRSTKSLPSSERSLLTSGVKLFFRTLTAARLAC